MAKRTTSARAATLRPLARQALWWLRSRTHPLRTDPRLTMDVVVRALTRGGGDFSFDEIRRIRNECRARDQRPIHGRRSGSTRVEDCYFLYLLVRRFRPRSIFEVGTLIGASASAMAEAQKENGGGVLYTVDGDYDGFEPVADHVIHRFTKQRSDEALSTLRQANRRIDFLFVDGTIGPEDVEVLNDIGAPDFVIALHDFKPPLDKGIRNAWQLSRRLEDAGNRVWILPERQGSGYFVREGLRVNSAIALFVPDHIAEELRAEGAETTAS